ncbi:ribosome-associated heat shock protein Hsp15 [Ferrimonas marina]|uniref:Heat shock protein 15 n=1 Tax=Ferrimonas marina TaxID=299255 RepID=A0A1M5Z8Y2_9GAMM|nr:ribosome-associated heat shock protein Hsp15 [Ferrimonas marina]SHI20681.1 ribosome-associated heat shock protein Hsp15 [Ferrimonas marina]
MSKQRSNEQNVNGPQQVRLDKWLWAARFYKTRALAQEMIAGGKVHVNGQRTKPSRKVECGATLVLWQGFDEKEIVVEGLSEKRLSAPLAQALYRETERSQAKREERAEQRRLLADDGGARRPDKKQRRQLLKIKHQDD